MDANLVSLGDWLREAAPAVAGLPRFGAWAAASVVCKLLVDATKTELLGNLFDRLGPVGKVLLVTFLPVAFVGTSALAAGADLGTALLAALGSAAGSVFLHEVLGQLKKVFGIT